MSGGDGEAAPAKLLALPLLLAIPVLKVRYTTGSSEATEEIFSTIGVDDWAGIVAEMVLSNPLLGAVLAVVLSHALFGYFASRRGAEPSTWRTAALTLLNPLAIGVVIGAVYGGWWGLGTAVVVLFVRGCAAAGRLGTRRWMVTAGRADRVVSLVMPFALLPLTAVAAAVDGRSWSPVVECDVDDGQQHRGRVVELDRKGNGVVGWEIESGSVVNGVGCARVEDRQVRDPFWG